MHSTSRQTEPVISFGASACHVNEWMLFCLIKMMRDPSTLSTNYKINGEMKQHTDRIYRQPFCNSYFPVSGIPHGTLDRRPPRSD
ncbi:hypothetical protein K443DRAFT_260512 [Laccaria amethystina LaAM-08-1]|uniref:Uncharacterized protein n=1 Tax=Laccaria amethystina LaAM-08-1 TaxID=1095629 RepID=A0A0C9WL92_9AGAR|nr:hypothetical protein K443DRAFT_260512 [Laccaria amethystina LaAM-08-1]